MCMSMCMFMGTCSQYKQYIQYTVYINIFTEIIENS